MAQQTGSCLCGQVRYVVRGALRPVVACHCRQCRKTSGHHVAATSARREDLTVEGDVAWYRSSSFARRGFCGVCGGNLCWGGPGDCGSRLPIAPPWEASLDDGLPQAEGDDPALSTVVGG